jgi:hypothetical protein
MATFICSMLKIYRLRIISQIIIRDSNTARLFKRDISVPSILTDTMEDISVVRSRDVLD